MLWILIMAHSVIRNPALNGGSGLGCGDWLGLATWPHCCPLSSSPQIPQAEQLEGVCSWAGTPALLTKTIEPSCRMMCFWCTEKFYPSMGSKCIRMWICVIFERRHLVHILNCAHPLQLYSTPTLSVLCTFDSKVCEEVWETVWITSFKKENVQSGWLSGWCWLKRQQIIPRKFNF